MVMAVRHVHPRTSSRAKHDRAAGNGPSGDGCADKASAGPGKDAIMRKASLCAVLIGAILLTGCSRTETVRGPKFIDIDGQHYGVCKGYAEVERSPFSDKVSVTFHDPVIGGENTALIISGHKLTITDAPSFMLAFCP